MVRESIITNSQVNTQELLDFYVNENSQLRLELQSYKMLSMKLISGIKELEESLSENESSSDRTDKVEY